MGALTSRCHRRRRSRVALFIRRHRRHLRAGLDCLSSAVCGSAGRHHRPCVALTARRRQRLCGVLAVRAWPEESNYTE